MRRFRKSTIHEVAQQAGVSITTVSVFVSGRETVCSHETAERIRKAISDLHYTPSSLVRSVQRHATTTFGVCMYHPLDPDVAYGNLFFERLWRGVVAEADAADYSLLHYPASVRSSGHTDAFLDGRVDGLLYHTHRPHGPDARPDRLAAAGMPLVLLTRSHDLPEGAGAAFADETGTADLALSHLWQLGHRRIAHIAGPIGPEGDDVAVDRLEAYRDWMRARGAYDPALESFAGEWECDEAVAGSILQTWMQLPHPPTAVFCANDALAFCLTSALQARGGTVPGTLSLVGVDNTPETAAAGLTSIEPPNEEVGRVSVRALIRLLQGAPLAECRIAVPVTRLLIRSSTTALTHSL